MYDKAVPYLAQLDHQYTNIRRLEDWAWHYPYTNTNPSHPWCSMRWILSPCSTN